MTQDTPGIDNILLYQIILLHEAYHKIESQLHHLQQITTIGTDVSDKLHAYFTLKETDMVSHKLPSVKSWSCTYVCIQAFMSNKL